MFASVFRKSLRDQRRAIIGWGIAVAVLVLVESAMWPSLRDMPDLDQFMANYPESLRKLFNVEDFGTGIGFMNTELFSTMLPIFFIVFAIGRGARAIAGEEEDGTLDVLLVSPVSPARLVAEQAAALAAAIGVVAAVLYVAALGSSAVVGLGISPVDLAAATLAMALLGVEFGWLALAVGAATGRRGVAIAVAATAAGAAYVLYAAGQLVDAVRPWQPLSPFHQALAGGPLGAGLPLAYLWMALAAAVFVAAAMPVFDRRDIVAH